MGYQDQVVGIAGLHVTSWYNIYHLGHQHCRGYRYVVHEGFQYDNASDGALTMDNEDDKPTVSALKGPRLNLPALLRKVLHLF